LGNSFPTCKNVHFISTIQSHNHVLYRLRDSLNRVFSSCVIASCPYTTFWQISKCIKWIVKLPIKSYSIVKTWCKDMTKLGNQKGILWTCFLFKSVPWRNLLYRFNLLVVFLCCSCFFAIFDVSWIFTTAYNPDNEWRLIIILLLYTKKDLRRDLRIWCNYYRCTILKTSSVSFFCCTDRFKVNNFCFHRKGKDWCCYCEVHLRIWCNYYWWTFVPRKVLIHVIP